MINDFLVYGSIGITHARLLETRSLLECLKKQCVRVNSGCQNVVKYADFDK